MVSEELKRENSPIIEELNEYFILAEYSAEAGDWEQSNRIYKDIVIAGQMMYEEAAEHIRTRIAVEEELREMKVLADQYYKNGQYEKSKKILEKILEEVEGE